jgi:hypothetical protein
LLAGSLSRGAADDVSDIEMLIVTSEELGAIVSSRCSPWQSFEPRRSRSRAAGSNVDRARAWLEEAHELLAAQLRAR